jgi:hypothetical protein
METLSHHPAIRVIFKGWSDSPTLPPRYVASCDRYGIRIRPEVLCAHGQTASEAQQEVAQRLLDRINARFNGGLVIVNACTYSQAVYFVLE